MDNIVIATTKEWNIKNFFLLKDKYGKQYNLYLITSNDELSLVKIKNINPKYIFFPHWSWIIPSEIYDNYTCVVFHMTDLPFGRGGSPLQNLILNGIYDTKVTAIKVQRGLDEGDVYIKEDLNIAIGSAEEIFIRISELIFNKMIPKILDTEMVPVKQTGEPTVFRRRTPKQSHLKELEEVSLIKLYDFIRMLDADGYPKAYIKLDKIKIEFSEVHLKNKKLVGRFEVAEDE